MQRLPRLAALTADAAGWGFFLCVSKQLRAGRDGSDYLALLLQDASGQIDGRIFDDAARLAAAFDEGDYVRVEGRAAVYRGRPQLVLSAIRRVRDEPDRADGFREDDCVLSAPRPIDAMWDELAARVAAVSDPHLRVLLHRILADHGERIREWPAARAIHHAYRGGLLEHLVKMAEVGTFVARAYDADADLVLAGVLLHDIGKLQELDAGRGAADYTRDGNLLGHLALGVLMVREACTGIAGFPLDLRSKLEHLVLSHHGSRERGSPVEPKTAEAFILAAIDELDALLNQVRNAVRADRSDGEFTDWHRRLGRVLHKG